MSARAIKRFWVGGLLVATFICITLLSVRVWPLYVYAQEKKAIRAALDELQRDRCPEKVDVEVWKAATGWTITAYENICFSEAHVPIGELKRFRADIEKRLAGDVDLSTTDWIWQRLAETGPHGRLYRKEFEPEYRLCLYSTVPFATLRNMSSFQARVDKTTYWDNKEFKIGETPELWVYVTQTNGVRLQIVWRNATTQDAAFARSLQISNSYLFPEVWHEFVTPRDKN
jgi:hypothetical protein